MRSLSLHAIPHYTTDVIVTNVNVCDRCNDDGITPVHQAASEGHILCLKALLEVGAKVNGVDHRGHSPLDLAKLWGHRKCARSVDILNLCKSLRTMA